MTDVLLPPDIEPREVRWGTIDSTSAFSSDTSGAIRSSEIVGGRALTPTLIWPPLKNQIATVRRSPRLVTALNRLRGQAGRAWFPPPGHVQQGSFPAPELLPNNTFANGTSGYINASGSDLALSAKDRMFRCTRAAVIASRAVTVNSPATVIPFAPYAARAFLYQGGGTLGHDVRLGASSGFSEYGVTTTHASTPGLVTLGCVPYGSTAYFGVGDWINAPAKIAGDYWESPFFSLARCAQLDNGANALPFSDDFSNAAWDKIRSSIAATAATLPNGASGTVNVLHEDGTASNTHYIEEQVAVDAAVQDVGFALAVKALARSWVQIVVKEDTGSSNLIAHFNSSTGAVGVTSAGANWADVRTAVANLGNGWFYVAVLGRKTNAATSLTVRIVIAEADNDTVFSGLNQDSLAIWRATMAPFGAINGMPARLVATAGTAAASGTAQTGTRLATRGWPASSSGLLLPGDYVQIGRELHMVAAAVDSDAAGLATLQLCGAIRSASTDGAPIIVNNPMGKFLLAKNILDWSQRPGDFTDLEVEFLEATAG